MLDDFARTRKMERGLEAGCGTGHVALAVQQRYGWPVYPIDLGWEGIEYGRSLGVDYSITLSCYDPSPNGEACGHCDACKLRLKGFAEAGVADPAPYAIHS